MVYSHDFPMISLMISGRGSAPTQEQRRQTAENLAGALSGMEREKCTVSYENMCM